MKPSPYAFTVAAMFAVSAPAIANAREAGVYSEGARGHAGAAARAHSVRRHDSRSHQDRDGLDGVRVGGSYPLQNEDRDRGVYLGQRHDD